MAVRKMTRCALFAALTAICAWISIPVPPLRFTLQSFAIALGLMTLGGKGGTNSVVLYLLLGAAGLPVFSGFRGGLAALMDPAGGFLWGFLLGAASYCLVERWSIPAALAAFSAVCYGCGCLWFSWFSRGVGFFAAFMTCVAPYLLPDIIKLILAWILAKKLKRYV